MQKLYEGLNGGEYFIADRTKIVESTSPSGIRFKRIPGRFSVCDSVNGNGRRYRRAVWEKNLKSGSTLMESIKRNAAFGLLEHPSDGQISLLSPISHLVTDAKLTESKDEKGNTVWEVHGEITVLNTAEGNKLSALIEAGYNPLVSSRGFGSLQRASDGVDEVCEDYVCEGWDVVIKPSFSNAELTPDRAESQKESKEDLKPQAVVEAAKAQTTGAAPSAEASRSQQTLVKTMNITELKSKIGAFRASVSEAKTPERLAECLTGLAELHTNVDAFIAEDAKRNYEGTKLHREIEAIESAIQEAALAPAKQAAKLQENNLKLMQVTKAVAGQALSFKKKLAESGVKLVENEKLISELIENGQGWKKLADARKAKAATLEEKYQTACEALDIMRQRYFEAVTAMGKKILTQDFPEAVKTPEIQKALKEATKPKHVLAVREQLEKAGKPAEKPVNESAAKEGTPAAAVTEGKKEEPKAPVTENKNSDGKSPSTEAPKQAEQPVTESSQSPLFNPRTSVVESIGIAKRLSAAAIK
jgi:hypothetical protein